MIRGITIQLLERAQTGVDGYGSPVYTETAVDVANVLVAPIETTSVPTSPELAYAKAAYLLAVPKRDTHVWENCRVVLPEPFSGTYYVVGKPTAGIEANIPGPWNKKVYIERWVFVGASPEALALLAETPKAHGIFEPAGETPRTVTATLRHIEAAGGFDGKDNRLRPVYILVLDGAEGYAGEKLCIFRGKRCAVVGAAIYGQYCELRIREATVDAE